MIARSAEHDELLAAHARHREQRHDDHRQHHHGPEVGLEQHQADRYRGQRDDHGEAPGVEFAAVLVAVAGERHDDPELRQLRRLEREPARELEPRLMALDVRAHGREHREQQEHGAAVEHHACSRACAGSRCSSTTIIATKPSPANSAWRFTK